MNHIQRLRLDLNRARFTQHFSCCHMTKLEEIQISQGAFSLVSLSIALSNNRYLIYTAILG